MKIALFGYREWVRDIFESITTDPALSDVQFTHVNVPESSEVDFSRVKAPLRTIDPKDKTGMVKYLDSEKPDLSLMYGWSWMVSAQAVEKYKCVCLHPSPLPKYRGGSPIQHQILNGERESAVTLFLMREGCDDGPILAQEAFSLEGKLQDVMSEIAAKGTSLTRQLLLDYSNGAMQTTEQDHSIATEFRRRRPADSEILPSELLTLSGRNIYDKVRCLQDPYPNAFIRLGTSKVYLRDAEIEDTDPSDLPVLTANDLSHPAPQYMQTGLPFFLSTKGGGVRITEYKIKENE